MVLRIIVRLGTYAAVLLLLVVASVGMVAIGAGVSFEDASWAVLVGSILVGGMLVTAVPPIAEWLLRRLAPHYASVTRREHDSVRELQVRARERRRERTRTPDE